MKVDRTELRKGLAETRRFLLAHHLPSEFYRCYSPVLFGRRVRVCARCLGIYPGLVAGVLSYLALAPGDDLAPVVAVLPAPALADWALTAFGDRRGYNIVRTATGALLGCGYGLGISLLLFEADLSVLGIGLLYAIVSGVLIYRSW